MRLILALCVVSISMSANALPKCDASMKMSEIIETLDRIGSVGMERARYIDKYIENQTCYSNACLEERRYEGIAKANQIFGFTVEDLDFERKKCLRLRDKMKK